MAKGKHIKTLPVRKEDLMFSADMFLTEGRECERRAMSEEPAPPESPSVDSAEDLAETDRDSTFNFNNGDLVRVIERNGPGKNSLSGVGRIMGESDFPGCYVVKFSLGGRDKRVPASAIRMHDLFDDNALIESVKRESLGEPCIARVKRARVDETNSGEVQPSVPSETQDSPVVLSGPMDAFSSSSVSNSWVRRSFRNSGKQQLESPKVQALLARLYKNDPNDLELEVLRLKNHIDADSNKHVMFEVLNALEKNSVVQALYIQNMEEGMDDEMLQRLTEVLEVCTNIWSLNVGENFGISREGWEKFAEDLKNTHVTHMYAGSETTVYGQLKVKMREVIRANRIKHTQHNDPNNLRVIRQIGQMWWNPRNSRNLTSFLTKEELGERKKALSPLVGRLVSIEYDHDFRDGRIAKFNEEHQLHLVVWNRETCNLTGKESMNKLGTWVSLRDTKHLLSDRVVWVCPPKLSDETKEPPSKPKKKLPKLSDGQFKSRCTHILTSITALPAAKYFMLPGNWRSSGMLDSPENVTHAVDLQSIGRKLRKNDYQSAKDFASDVRLVFSNCLLHNKEVESATFPIRRWATELLEFFEEMWKEANDEVSEDVDQNIASGLVPGLVYKHCALLPEEQKLEQGGKEVMVRVLSDHSWFWFRPHEMTEWNKVSKAVKKSIEEPILAEAEAEQRIHVTLA